MLNVWINRISSGVVAGIVWGWLSLAINRFTGVLTPESGLVHDLATFTLAGALFGLVVAGMIFLARGWIPFKGSVARAVLVSSSVWVVLRLGAGALSIMEPERYHVITPETVQGLGLAVLLGLLLGLTARLTPRAMDRDAC